MPRLRFPSALASLPVAALVPLLAAAWVVAVVAPTPARAAGPQVFTLDAQATRVTFGFGATLHSVVGSLRVVEGAVRFDPESGQASGDIVLDMTTASTGNSRRDRKMHEKILETGRYPRAVYHVERVSGTFRPEGASDLLLRGVLDFHGVSQRLDLPATARVEGERVTATGKVTIPYVEWGLRDPSFFLLRVGKQVRVEVQAVGRVTGVP